MTGVSTALARADQNNCKSSGTCLIAVFYDQTGNENNCTQATAADMALNIRSRPGGKASGAFRSKQ
jgi:hypothetical protein